MVDFLFDALLQSQRLTDRLTSGDTQDAREVAVQIDDQFSTRRIRRENDLLDHGSDFLRGFATTIRGVQLRNESLHCVVEALRHVRMNEHRGFVFGFGRSFQSALVLLQIVDFVLDEGRINARFERLQQLLDLPLSVGDVNLNAILGCALFATEAVDRVRIFLAEYLAGFWLHEASAQSAEYDALELVLADRETVLTDAFVARA